MKIGNCLSGKDFCKRFINHTLDNARIFMEAEYSDSLTGTPVAGIIQTGVGDTVSMMGAGDTSISLEHLQGIVDKWAEKAALMLGETLK